MQWSGIDLVWCFLNSMRVDSVRSEAIVSLRQETGIKWVFSACDVLVCVSGVIVILNQFLMKQFFLEMKENKSDPETNERVWDFCLRKSLGAITDSKERKSKVSTYLNHVHQKSFWRFISVMKKARLLLFCGRKKLRSEILGIKWTFICRWVTSALLDTIGKGKNIIDGRWTQQCDVFSYISLSHG